MRHLLKVVCALVVTGAVVPSAASAADYARTAMDIVPSGQPGSIPAPPGADTQAQMYNALTPLFNHVTDAQLPQFYKPEPLGTANSGPLRTEAVPRAGVTLIRDRFDVPHITGVTRDDVTWAAGWVEVEDRDRTGVGYAITLDSLQCGGFSRTIRSQDSEDLAPVHREAQVIHGPDRAIGLDQVLHGNSRATGCSIAPAIYFDPSIRSGDCIHSPLLCLIAPDPTSLYYPANSIRRGFIRREAGIRS